MLIVKFCDYAKVFVESGAGGNGAVSFRREKNIPFGGPDGGHGGRGGSVYLEGTTDLVTLIDFRYRPHYRAPSGQAGQGRNKAGTGGKDCILKVPVGTEVWVEGEMVEDLTENKQRLLLLKGGDGGRGNSSFASSTNRAPRENTPGQPGSQLWIELRLKLLADVGLIGLPNAGKSTLLKEITSACPKIGPYPFTTLVPQLGTLISDTYQELVVADLPGLIEGAHEGKGLGHRFLGHGERCRSLLHIIDGTSDTITETYQTVRQELLAYNPAFKDKLETVVITKSDMMTPEQKEIALKSFPTPPFIISALGGEGIEELKDFLCQHFAH